MDFVHLHVHSHYSLLNGLPKVKPLVKAAKKRGFKALALTDYGSMYGAIEFYQACLAEDIKPIIGFEAYVAPHSRHDKDPEKDKGVYHLMLLAENFEGYQNLMRLSSLGHVEGFFNDKPRIDKDLLKEYGKGIIALSGPIEGEVPQLLKNNKDDDAKKVVHEFEEIFGKGNFYLELQDHPAIEGQMQVNTKLIQLSKDIDIPLVVTRDVHYLDFNEAEAQDILRCISNGWKVGQTDREDFRHVDRSFNTAKDIISRFKHVPEAIENTVKIADRINIEIPLDNWHFAPVDLPEGKNADEHLRDEAYKYVVNFYEEVTQEIKDRIEYELDIIKTKGYSPYFISVADYVGYAKRNGIVESTRGSAAGSLVSYVLGITTVDPMRFKLPFERFLNPYRPSPPDIDTDFADDRRDEMIEYMTKKYGKDRVAQIITFGTMAARASVRDVGRALGLSYSFCDQVAKLIPQGAQGFPMTIERALKEEPDLKKLYETNEDLKRLLDLAQQVEGCARHTSIHAAGLVVSPTPLTDFSPVQCETGGEKILTQYEMHAVESAGVLKNDFLGIRNLAILGNSVVIVKKTTGDEIDIYNLPLNDTKTFEMLARGETMGVFQLAGAGMTRWVKELKPNRIEDIMAMVALYRPGPMESIPEYIHRKYNSEAVSYLDPRLEKILDASYG
ncbi:DNA polymerase III subunit alpha, partial [Candidatus Parcubacteria bacterium]|nr:DNA polymerase III subunit alpha [Candidatus Parcubacteria bacterium]